MYYAVNIIDMTREPVIMGLLLSPVTPGRFQVDAEPGMVDGKALLIESEPERALAICQVIRLKQPKHLLRCYESKTGKGGWRRI